MLGALPEHRDDDTRAISRYEMALTLLRELGATRQVPSMLDDLAAARAFASPAERFGLTPREQHVLHLLGQGRSAKEIGRLFVSNSHHAATGHVANLTDCESWTLSRMLLLVVMGSLSFADDQRKTMTPLTSRAVLSTSRGR